MSFIHRIEVPLGESVVIPATTVYVVLDERGAEPAYSVEHGPGAQHPRGVAQ